MLRAADVRLSGLSVLPVIVVTIGCVAGPAIALAGAQSGHRNFRGTHATVNRPHIVHVGAKHHEYRHVFRSSDRFQGVPRYRGYSGNASAYLEAGSYGFGGQSAILDQQAMLARPPSGPISFADLPASTGIRAAPLSAPLFMRVGGRQVVADDGEKYLWRAGPKIVDLGNPVGQRRARQGQTRQTHADMINLDAPKIIVIRP
jgi:hypothetical protein